MSGNITVPYTSWGKGELSPMVRGHVDTTHYYASAKSLDNMLVRPYAVPVRRAGTKCAGEVKDSTQDVRLIEFVFSVDQSYIIEMGEFYLRIFDSSGDAISIITDDAPLWTSTIGTFYYIGNLVQIPATTAWTISTFYSTGDRVSNLGSVYSSIFNQYSSAFTEPGVGGGWESFWTLSTADTPGVYRCILENTPEEANRPGTAGGATYWEIATETSPGSGEYAIEIKTPYSEAEIWDVDYAQKNDVIKMTHHEHDIAELRRLDEDQWEFVDTGLIEGAPWEALNEDLTLRMKSNGISVGTPRSIQSESGFDAFTASDEGRYFRIGGLNTDGEQGYFRCDEYVDSRNLSGENIVAFKNDSLQSTWARNAFYTDPVTGEKNYPAHVTFHEGRLDLSNTTNDPAKHWLSKEFIYNDFNVGDTVAFGFDMEANTAQANPIKWVSSSNTLVTGTFGAEFSTESPAESSLNNDNQNIREQSSWGSEFVRPVKIGNRLYYVQRTGRKVREYFFSFDVNNFQSNDMTEYSDHITISGIKDMHYQRNQDSLLWTVLENGKMAILSRHPEQEIQAWTPWETKDNPFQFYIPSTDKVKSIRFIPSPDGNSDRGFIIVERTSYENPQLPSTKKYIEYFDNHVVEEDTLQSDLYYVDSGVLVNQYELTDGISLTIPPSAVPTTITAGSAFFTSDMTGHNINIIDENGDTVRTYEDITYVSPTEVTIQETGSVPELVVVGGLWGVSTDFFAGLGHLNYNACAMFCDGVYIGTDVPNSSGETEPEVEFYKGCSGLPYTSTFISNPLNSQTPSGMAKGKIRRIHEISIELYKSLEMEWSNTGNDADWYPVGVPEGVDSTVLFTGTVPNISFEGKLDYDAYIYLRQTKPYSMNLLGIYARAEIAEGK